MPSLYRCLLAAVALAMPSAFPRGALAADPGSLIIIMDGSGSMWGPLEGARQSKLVIAREALRRSLGKLSPGARVGLAAFGHRRGDCSDVELMRSPEPLDGERLMGPLDQLNPRGRGPLTLALREAARSMSQTGGRRTLLLIHDDADNCQPDLCAAAAELRAANVTANVVGLATKPDDMAKMACLPQITGGRHFTAQNAEQAATAIEEALLISAPEMGGLQARTSSPTAIVPPPPIPASGPPALYLRALPAANTEPLNIPLYWTVAAEDRRNVILFATRAANPIVPIPPGRYVVEVRDGPLAVTQTVEVRDNRPANVTMLLNAGVARIRATARRNAEPLADAIITVTDGNGSLALASSAGEAVALLPAGRYVVRAEVGLVRSEQAVTITAGRVHAVDLSINAAQLQITTTGRDGKSGLEAPVFSILEDDPDASGGKREIARSAAQPADFLLSPGTYYVVARQGAVEVRERLAIGPGDVVRRSLPVTAGNLALSTKPPPFGAGADTPISYTIARIDNVAQDTITTSQPSPTLLLPSGRYRVEGRYGLMNVRSVHEVEIKTGQTQQLVFEQEAAALRLRVTGSGPADVSWVVRDEAGNAVWTGAHNEAVANLQAGRYVVRAETRNKRDERTVELRAGEAKLLEFSTD